VKFFEPLENHLVKVRLQVELCERGMRLDRLIQKHFQRLSRERVHKIIDQGVFLEGQSPLSIRIRAAMRVKEYQCFYWIKSDLIEEERDIDIPVIYEDARFLVLNKPGNLVVHPTASAFRNTVTYWLKQHHPQAKIAHRLDKDTSGVLLCGKNEWSAYLKAHFRLLKMQKTYIAIVKGVPRFDKCTVDAPLRLDEDCSLKVKMKVDKINGLPSLTEVEVIARYANYSVVKCYPKTGRQHQIRVHLWSLGFPVLGDKLYGVSESVFKESVDLGITPRVLEATGAHRHMLHAYALALVDKTNQHFSFVAPLPIDMQHLIPHPSILG